ncbi:pseudouridine synthase deg1 [Coemansia sp. IMI 209128]|nr:pseudouridine synthase deg1 [Coemansia sp. IMI 209128]
MDYSRWSKRALIERLQSLDKLVGEQEPATATNTDIVLATTLNVDPVTPKRKRPPTRFDFANFPKRKVAFKFSYFGWAYHGLARQGNALESEEKRLIESEFPTIEGEVFRALASCKLIEDESSCDYSRCGRTDRGVSGFGQVIALYVRSAGQFITDEQAEAELAKGTDASRITRDEQNGGRAVLLPLPERELPYVNMLNKTLPPAIRILAWSPVKAEFDARFSCRSRFYRYFFSEEGLDIDAMKEAARKYLGQHDFRNFCRLDPAKQISNFERNVLDIDINPVAAQVPFVGEGQSAQGRWWQLELRGTAFLWHQVRCMMAILFHVGQGLEEPSIVDKMLDVENMNGKPEYEMACDVPLVLADCAFDATDVQWIHLRNPGNDFGNMAGLDRAISNEWGQLNTRAVIASALLQNLRSTAVPMLSETKERAEQLELAPWAQCRDNVIKSELATRSRIVLGGGEIRHVRDYQPMAKRRRADPVHLRNKVWFERKGDSKRVKTTTEPDD